MITLYRLFGFLYLVSGLWCVFQLELAARFLGFELLAELGRSEFLSVYGGLQIGIGVAMLASSFKSEYLEAGVAYSGPFRSLILVLTDHHFWNFPTTDSGFIRSLFLDFQNQ